MSGSIELSIIVPAYNAAEHLEQCLESLKAQTATAVEFICIDDGSTDATLEMMRRYEREDRRFSCIAKPNSGYGHTMNTGIAQARGAYIGFLESDDWIEPHALEALMQVAGRFAAPDIVKANHYTFDDATGDERFVENFPESICLQPIGLPGPGWRDLVVSVPAIWAAVYRADFLRGNDVRFLETPGASFQDTGFVNKAWIAARSVVLVHEGYLHYRFGNEGSSTVSDAKVRCVLDEWASIDAYAHARAGEDRVLLEALAQKKFQTYDWNLKRIAPDHAGEFVMAAREDLLAARQAGLLQQEQFRAAEWGKLRRWLDDPASVVLDRQIAGEAGSLKRFLLRSKRKARNLRG